MSTPWSLILGATEQETEGRTEKMGDVHMINERSLER